MSFAVGQHEHGVPINRLGKVRAHPGLALHVAMGVLTDDERLRRLHGVFGQEAGHVGIAHYPPEPAVGGLIGSRHALAKFVP